MTCIFFLCVANVTTLLQFLSIRYGDRRAEGICGRVAAAVEVKIYEHKPETISSGVLNNLDACATVFNKLF